MKIYDFYNDNSMATVIFVAATITCLVVLSSLIIYFIKTIKKGVDVFPILLLAIGFIIVLVLICYLSYYSFMLVKFNIICVKGDYEMVTGPAEIVKIERNDYRDSELYNIEFVVDKIQFKTVNSYSVEEKELIVSNLDKDIQVLYSYIGNELIIYQIIICLDE